MDHPFPLHFCILQVIKNWTMGRPGYKARFTGHPKEETNLMKINYALIWKHSPLMCHILACKRDQKNVVAENRPTLENKPTSFFYEAIAKDVFLSEVRPPIKVIVQAVMSSKKHQRSGATQEEGLTNEGRHHLLLLYKQAHDKRSIAEHSLVLRLSPSRRGWEWGYCMRT